MLSTPAWLRSRPSYRRLRALCPVRQLIQARYRRIGRASLELGRHFDGLEPRVVAYPGHSARARVGDFTQIGGDVVLMLGGNHRTDWITAYHFRLQLGLGGATHDDLSTTRGDIIIGNDVFIGRGATILSGVRVGNGAIVGAEAVVTKEVRPYAVVAGNPAVEIRRRFSDAQVDALERIAWWDWPLERIVEQVPWLNSTKIDAFIAEFDPQLRS